MCNPSFEYSFLFFSSSLFMLLSMSSIVYYDYLHSLHFLFLCLCDTLWISFLWKKNKCIYSIYFDKEILIRIIWHNKISLLFMFVVVIHISLSLSLICVSMKSINYKKTHIIFCWLICPFVFSFLSFSFGSVMIIRSFFDSISNDNK